MPFGRKATATATVMAYRVYTAELRQFGAPAIIIVTSWQTPDEVLHAEWFAIQGTQFASEPISCDKRSLADLPFESEDDMMAEALRRAREHLQGKRDMLPEPVRSNQEKKRHPLFLVQAWLRGRATALKGVASNTGCPKLGPALNRIVRLPVIISPDDG
jgi:hypothetical protein